MCLRPVTILNPKYKNETFLRSVDKEYITVPCGFCEECSHKKTNDLVVRSYYEWLDCVSHGGFTLFDTLTYSEEYVPKYNGWYYFDRRDLRLFIKRLYSSLEYAGFNVRGNLSYLITTEYGGTTYRCHAHTLFNSKVPGLSPELLDEYIVRSWRDTGTGDYLGFHDKKAVQERVVNSVYGIHYVAKYCAKDTDILAAIKYHHDTELSQYFINLCVRNEIQLDFMSYSFMRQAFLAYKTTHDVPKDFELFNFTMISDGLGLSFLKNASIDDLFNDIMIQDQSDKQYTLYSVPTYFTRKYFYNYEKYSKRFVPNEYYALLRHENEKQQYKALCSNQRRLDDIFSALSSNAKSSLVKRYHLENSPDGYRKYINDLLAGRSIEHFAKYVIYLRNVHISPYLEWLYPGNLEILDDAFIDMFCEYRNDAVLSGELPFRTDLDEFAFHPEIYRHDSNMPVYTFNQLSQFENYDQLYSLIKDILWFYKQGLNKKYQEKKKEIERYHKTLKKRLARNVIFK